MQKSRKTKQRNLSNNQKITSKVSSIIKVEHTYLLLNQTKDTKSMKLDQVTFYHVNAYPKNLHFKEHKQPALVRNKGGLKAFLLNKHGVIKQGNEDILFHLH